MMFMLQRDGCYIPAQFIMTSTSPSLSSAAFAKFFTSSLLVTSHVVQIIVPLDFLDIYTCRLLYLTQFIETTCSYAYLTHVSIDIATLEHIIRQNCGKICRTYTTLPYHYLTFAPSLSKCSAIEAPIPEDAPVSTKDVVNHHL